MGLIQFVMLLIILCHGAHGSDDNYSVYKGYKIIEIIPKNQQQILALQALQNLQDKIPSLSILSSSKLPEFPVTILVPPQAENELLSLLAGANLPHKIINDDVLRSVRLERSQNSRRRSPSRIDFESYLRFDEITEYLNDLAQKYPQHTSLMKIGKSFEDREMTALRIFDRDDIRMDKKVIFVDAGIHAREWIAPATALYVIHQLVENFDNNRDLLNGYDWVILPVVNPDGYEYSHTKERFWRKTRQPHALTCDGADANRNFDFHWGETGASSYACAETYRGPKPFSEPEAEAVRKILHSFEGNCKMYLSLHSYGKYLLYPWGYDSALPSTWKDLDEVATAGAGAIGSTTGTNYTVGSATNVLYAASGASDDYAFGAANIPISITMELPGGGHGGFDPPPSQIKPFVEEAWIGIKSMAETVARKY